MGEPEEHSGHADADGDALLIEFLRERDTACPICGYNLRNLTRDVCPECGQRFRLRVGAVHPRFGYLLAFLAPLIMLAGFAILLVSVAIATNHRPSSKNLGFFFLALAGPAAGIATLVLYRKRAVFLRSSKRRQLLLASISWITAIAIVYISFRYGV